MGLHASDQLTSSGPIDKLVRRFLSCREGYTDDTSFCILLQRLRQRARVEPTGACRANRNDAVRPRAVESGSTGRKLRNFAEVGRALGEDL